MGVSGNGTGSVDGNEEFFHESVDGVLFVGLYTFEVAERAGFEHFVVASSVFVVVKFGFALFALFFGGCGNSIFDVFDFGFADFVPGAQSGTFSERQVLKASYVNPMKSVGSY